MGYKKVNLAKTASIIIVFNLISKLLGFVRDYLTAIKFGTSVEADSFLMASNIPNTLYVLIGIAITTTFIPLYNEVKENENQNKLNIFSSNIITILVIISIFLTIVSEIFTPNLVAIMAPGFTGVKFQLTVKLTRILSSVIILNTIVYIFMSILQSENNFKVPAAVGIPYNIALIVYFIFFSKKFGVVGISIMVSVALMLQVMLLVPSLKKVNFYYKPIINIREPYIKRMLILIGPVIIGTGIQQINAIFNGIYASSLGDGTVSSINYAIKLYMLIADIIIMSIITVAYQNLSKASAAKNYDELSNISNKTVILIFIVLIPIVLIVTVLSTPIIKVLFQRGAFNEQGTKMTATALYYYCLGLFGVGVNYVLTRVCYALNDTKTPMINTFFAVLINVVLGYVLKDIMGIGGIALASAGGSIIASILLYFSVKKKVRDCITPKSIWIILKLVLSSVPMWLILLIFYNKVIRYTNGTFITLMQITLISLIGVSIYIIIAYIMGIQELSDLFNMIKNKIKR